VGPAAAGRRAGQEQKTECPTSAGGGGVLAQMATPTRTSCTDNDVKTQSRHTCCWAGALLRTRVVRGRRASGLASGSAIFSSCVAPPSAAVAEMREQEEEEMATGRERGRPMPSRRPCEERRVVRARSKSETGCGWSHNRGTHPRRQGAAAAHGPASEKRRVGEMPTAHTANPPRPLPSNARPALPSFPHRRLALTFMDKFLSSTDRRASAARRAASPATPSPPARSDSGTKRRAVWPV
jgi:hypothetical protein